MTRLRNRRPGSSPRDEGSAVALVLIVMSVLLVVSSVGLSKAVGSLRFVDRSTDWNEALSAAEAGVDDYLARLNHNDGYWKSADCSNVALRGDPAVTGTVSNCGWGSSTALGWKPVVGSATASFHYDVVTPSSTTYSNGTINLISTGRVGTTTRTISVILRHGGFGEFLYYTVYETVDPADQETYGLNNSTAQKYCPQYYWQSRPTNYCQDIQFTTGDVINGPMHTNDAFLVSGSPKFLGTVTTSYPSCQATNGTPPPTTSCYRRTSSGASPTFANGIAYRPEIELPTSIGDLKQYVTSPVKNGQTALGCLYTGPTRIRFLKPASAGATAQMKVWSPFSQGTLNPGCGSTGAAAGALGNVNGAVVTVPQNNVIVVQNVPSSQTVPLSGACPGYDSSSTDPTSIKNGKVTGSYSGSNYAGIGDGLPLANDYNQTFDDNNCRYGTLYVQGSMAGRLTISADNNIVVTGDLTYAGGQNGTDALGLVAGNSVEIYHPVSKVCSSTDKNGNCTAYTYTNLNRPNGEGVMTNVSLQAAILSLQHSFNVQLYDEGAKLGTISLFGTIAQRFRGPVGTSGGTGYLKNYAYDSRLRYAPPPFFLDPVRSGWGEKTFGEVVPRYGG